MKNYNKKTDEIMHKTFEIGILIKGIDGILQIIGGVLLIFVSPERLNKIIIMITQHELSEDPKDIVMRYLINIGHGFSLSAQHFGVIYLILHGLIKLILYVLLLNKKRGAYPIVMISLILFIIYQSYRYIISNSLFMLILTVFDIVMLMLSYIEYKRLNSKQHTL